MAERNRGTRAEENGASTRQRDGERLKTSRRKHQCQLNVQTRAHKVSSLSVLFILLHIEAAPPLPPQLHNLSTHSAPTDARACTHRVGRRLQRVKNHEAPQIERQKSPTTKRPHDILPSSNHTTQRRYKTGSSALQTHLGAAPVTALRVVSGGLEDGERHG